MSELEALKQSIVTRRRLIGGFAGLLGAGAAVTLTSCGVPGAKPETVPSDDEIKAAITIRAFDNQYDPADVQIAPGQAVRWVFEGPAEHDVVAEDGSFVSDLVYEGSYTHLFEEPGEFPYDCSIHPEMTGIIRVVAP